MTEITTCAAYKHIIKDYNTQFKQQLKLLDFFIYIIKVTKRELMFTSIFAFSNRQMSKSQKTFRFLTFQNCI